MKNDRWSAVGKSRLNNDTDELNLIGSVDKSCISKSVVHSVPIATKLNSTNVSVRIGEILPFLAKAYEQGRQWARDFDDDQVQIPRDMLETIRVAKIFDQQKS